MARVNACLRACWRARLGEKMREARISGRVASFILLIKHRATELGVINWRVGCTRPTPRFFPRNNFSKRNRPRGVGKRTAATKKIDRDSRAVHSHELNGLFRGIFHRTVKYATVKLPACTLLQIKKFHRAPKEIFATRRNKVQLRVPELKAAP